MSLHDDWHTLGATWRDGDAADPAIGAAGDPVTGRAIDPVVGAVVGAVSGAVSDPAIDPDRILRTLRRQRRRSLAMMGLELSASVLCSVELIDQIRHPAPGRGNAWAWAMLGVVWVFQALLISLRRSPRRGPTLTPISLLEHTAARARTAIRLAWLNIGAMFVFAVSGLGLAISRWPDPAARRPIVVAASLSLGFVVGFSLVLREYLRKQRCTLVAAQALAVELADPLA